MWSSRSPSNANVLLLYSVVRLLILLLHSTRTYHPETSHIRYNIEAGDLHEAALLVIDGFDEYKRAHLEMIESQITHCLPIPEGSRVIMALTTAPKQFAPYHSYNYTREIGPS
jgi:hypothetical protein